MELDKYTKTESNIKKNTNVTEKLQQGTKVDKNETVKDKLCDSSYRIRPEVLKIFADATTKEGQKPKNIDDATLRKPIIIPQSSPGIIVQKEKTIDDKTVVKSLLTPDFRDLQPAILLKKKEDGTTEEERKPIVVEIIDDTKLKKSILITDSRRKAKRKAKIKEYESDEDESTEEGKKLVKTKFPKVICVLGVIIILLIAVLVIHFIPDKPPEKRLWNSYRLPSFIVPIHYDLTIVPNFPLYSFHGNVTIFFTVKEETKFIVLHSVDKKFQKPIVKENNTILMVKAVQYYRDKQQVGIGLNKILKPDVEHTIQFVFKKELYENVKGFYITSYTTLADGNKRYVTLTKFHPNYARYAFPCFDERTMKATFQLTILHDKNLTAYSNTEVNNTFESKNRRITVFKKTPKMSTNLVAFAVGDYKRIEDKVDGIKISVLAIAEQIEKCKFALNIATGVFSYFNSELGVKYPLSKLDIIVIPSEKVDGMYNWGLIEINQKQLLYSTQNSNAYIKQSIATQITHKIAHQWFGSLVTAKELKDEWINGGFVSYLEHDALDNYKPHWKMMSQFIVTTLIPTMDKYTPQGKVIADKELDYNVNFQMDTDIFYKKLGCIISMMDHVTSTATTFQYIRTYLQTYKYGIVDKEDFFNISREVKIKSDLPFPKIMESWLYEDGFPIVYVNYSSGLVKLKQMPFTIRDEVIPSNDYLWPIPVTYVTDSNDTTQTYWLNNRTGEISFTKNFSWIKLNSYGTGFYRVMYNEELWLILINEMNTDHKKFKVEDRTNLIDDVFNFAKAEILNESFAYALTEYLPEEEHYMPWEIALDHFKKLYKRANRITKEYLKKYIKGKIKRIVRKLKMDYLHMHLVRKLFQALSDAMKVFQIKFDPFFPSESKLDILWETEVKKSPRNLRAFAYEVGVQYGSKADWEDCWKKYFQTRFSSRTRLLLHSNSRMRNPKQLKKYFPKSLPTCKIHAEDVITVFRALTENFIFGHEVLSLLKQDFPRFVKICESSDLMRFLMIAVLSNFDTQSQYNEVRSYIPRIKSERLKKEFLQALEKIQSNIYLEE